MRFAPNTPLLWVTALVVVPAVGAVFYFGEGAGEWAALGVVLLVALVAAIDLQISAGRLGSLGLEAPDVVRCTSGREFAVDLRFSNRGEDAIPWLRYGFPLGSAFRAAGEVVASLPAIPAGKWVKAGYRLLPLRRGQFGIDACHVETVSRVGLWTIRRRFSIGLELRVYPDLAAERRRLSALFLHRGNEGGHAVRQVGKGREFEQLREYQHGDDYVDIDWKATARRGQPVTRTYQIERTQEVYVIVDHSRLSAREIRTPVEETEESLLSLSEHAAGGEFAVTTQLERFLHCALVLASVAERQGDLFGFVSFADQVDRFIRGRNGRDHFNIVRDSLYTLEPKMVAPDFEQLAISIRQRLTRRALLVMLVDLSDPLTAEHFYDSMSLLSRQHLILVNMIRPEGAQPLFSANASRPRSGRFTNVSADIISGGISARSARNSATSASNSASPSTRNSAPRR